MKLEDIGFYTLTDERAKNTSIFTSLKRCELIITNRCNFKCLYCKGRNDKLEDISFYEAARILQYWIKEKLQNIRFSGGEPTLYPQLSKLIKVAKKGNIERIAISTNGSNTLEYYKHLINCGVNDFSISLDACCASVGNMMSGNNLDWNNIIRNIEELSKLVYVTLGIVFTKETSKKLIDVINFGSSLGVADIRIISSTQYNGNTFGLESLKSELLDKHPILKYRVTNFLNKRNVREIFPENERYCWLMLDDMVVKNSFHYPCVIYMRERGLPIGTISKTTRINRLKWMVQTDTYKNPICKNNCLDICIDYNDKVRELL